MTTASTIYTGDSSSNPKIWTYINELRYTQVARLQVVFWLNQHHSKAQRLKVKRVTVSDAASLSCREGNIHRLINRDACRRLRAGVQSLPRRSQ